MKKIISILLCIVLLMSVLSVGMTVTAAEDGNAEAFKDVLDLLDVLYLNDSGYAAFIANEISIHVSDFCDNGVVTATLKADDYYALLNAYFEMNDTLLDEVSDDSFTSYDAETDTYTLFLAGGFGGILPEREYIGYKQNGDTYDVYYADIEYAYLSDVVDDEYKYAEELGNPEFIEYDGIVYEATMDGYVATLGLLDSGIKYTVAYTNVNAEFDFTYESAAILLSEVLPEGTDADEYAASLGNPDTIEYEGVTYTYSSYFGYYYHYITTDEYITKDATLVKSEKAVKIISYCDYTEKDLPESFDTFDSADVFVDLTVNDWSKEGIDYVVSHGYMNGTGNGTTFDQTGTMTRAMIVSVLYRIAGSPAPEGANPFTDLQADQTWYHNAVIWAYENNIVSGTGATTFSPTGAVTREQMATFISRFAKFMGYDTETENDISSFPDFASVSSWAVDGLAWANENGIITGAASGGVTILAPQGEATREQVATILMRFCVNFN